MLISFYAAGHFIREETTIDFNSSSATVLLALIGQSIPIVAKFLTVRILVISTCVTGALVLWGFQAGIVSVLTVDNKVFFIKTLKVIFIFVCVQSN